MAAATTHSISPRLSVCSTCGLSCEAIYTETPLYDRCPGRPLDVDALGFPMGDPRLLLANIDTEPVLDPNDPRG